jgi:signal transduction histidine kinase
MKLSFRNRIATLYMLATAFLMAIVFGIIYGLVFQRVYQNLDADLSFEAEKHSHEVRFVGENLEFVNLKEWEEHEHKEVQINPVFIQFVNAQGKNLNKSPNLKNSSLPFYKEGFDAHFNSFLNNRSIRQIQLPILEQGKTKAYILAAMSSESSISVLETLKLVLITAYLLVLLSLYFVSRFLAGRSIKPVSKMTNTINRITKNNLQERVELPVNKDELYDLARGFNALLTRIENALEREKQFTSDASHEIRTPLAVLKGTLEVLIRRPRTEEEYQQKIAFCLTEIDRLTQITEQLLLLARIESKEAMHTEKCSITTLLEQLLARKHQDLAQKGLEINWNNSVQQDFLVPKFYTELILENALSNAIKYSSNSKTIDLEIGEKYCSITDYGIGIKEEDLPHLFQNFYRSDALSHKEISGVGLGLSIAKKSADLIGAQIVFESKLGQGTKFSLKF